MKNKYIFVLSFISFLIISCSNLMDVREETPADSTPAAYTVSGKLVTEYESNVGPRSAFPANDVDLTLYTTKFYYKSSPTATERTLCGTTTGSDFELKLPSLGTYYLEAESYKTANESRVIEFKTLQPIEITLDATSPYKDDVGLFLHSVEEEFDEDNPSYGRIKLRIKYVSEIVKVTRGYVYDSGIQHEYEIDIDDNNIWEASGLLALPYTFVFKFFNAEDVLVYQCYESVTLFPDKTTDTWINNGNAEYFSTETIDGKETVVMNITQECLNNFALTNFYVDPAAAASGNGSYFAPVKTLKAAVDKCTDATKNYTINIVGTVEVSTGIDISKNILIKKAEEATSAKIKYLGTPERLFTVQTGKITISNVDIEGLDAVCDSVGAAIYNDGTLILNNVNFSKFKNGSGTGKGGCLYNAGEGTISITGGSITECSSAQGGAIYNAGKDIEIKDCTINSCQAGQAGGAIYNHSSAKITLTGNTVIGDSTTNSIATDSSYGNKSDVDGGAIYLENGELYLKGNTVIARNYTGYNGGGGVYLKSDTKIYMQDSASIKNCTASSNGGGVYLGNGAKVYLQDSASIISCSAASGSGIYASSAMCRVYMKDSAYLDSASDIRLNANGYVSLNGDLTPPVAANGIAATLTPQFYDPDDDSGLGSYIQLLEEDTAGLIAGNYSKFAVTSKDANPAIEWYVTVNGKLNSKAPGDVLFATLNGVAPTDTSKVYVMDTIGELETLAGWVNTSNSLEGIHFKLNTDITLDNTWPSIGKNNATNPFKGKFDGNNKTITYDSTEYALFAYTENAEISNVITKGILTAKYSQNGAVVNYLKGGKISNCVNYAKITANSTDVGGIVGKAVSVDGDLTCIIENCSNYGNITTDRSIANMGGIVGIATSVTVRNCYNAGNITGPYSIGGIAGQTNANYPGGNRGSLYENCGNIGTISATQADTATKSGAGGIVGGIPSNTELYKPEFINCWSLGTINANSTNYKGALLGTPYFKKFTNCYYNTTVISYIAAQTQTVNGVASTNDNDSLVNKLNTWAIDNGKTEYKTWVVKDGKVVFSDM